jgi:putative FmdB family regulatory protein
VPIYGYRCQSCEHEFEVTQRMSDAAQASCPVCSGAGRRQFFATGIHFKGSGFYKTDSRSAPAAAAAASDGNGQKKPSTSPSDGSGSKPAKDASGASSPAPTTPPKSTPPKAASTAD